MIIDSGCSNHYVMLNTPILNKQLATNPIHVLQPNGTKMSSTYTCELPLAFLSPTARKGHVMPSLKSGALLSLGQLYDDGCHVFFDKCQIQIYKGDTIILAGDRNFTIGMWHVHILHSNVPPLRNPTPMSTTSPPDRESNIPHIPLKSNQSDPNN